MSILWLYLCRSQAVGFKQNRTQLFATGVEEDRLSVPAARAALPTQDAVFKFIGLGAAITAGAYAFHPQMLGIVSGLQQEFALVGAAELAN